MNDQANMNDQASSSLDKSRWSKGAQPRWLSAARVAEIIILLLFGVLLPIVTLTVEYTVHLCGEIYVNLIPTYVHVALIAAVPTAIGLSMFSIATGKLTHPRWLGLFLGVAIISSLYFSAAFIPLAWIFLLMVLACGFGFLPLSPIITFILSTYCAIRIGRTFKVKGMAKFVGLGAAAATVLILAIDVPFWVTQVGLDKTANAKTPEDYRAAIRLIRAFGSNDCLLRSCYEHCATLAELPKLFVSGNYIDRDSVRKIFYRVTGTPFNTLPKPDHEVGLQFNRSWFNRDRDLASDQVGGRAEGVSLSQSAIKGQFNATAGVGYLEWAMDFSNTSLTNQEARTQIVLPHGAVVSRACLWINGQPHEAVFGAKDVVRQAYVNVVMTSRDPLLVTQSSRDQVMIQCFPVPHAPLNSTEPGHIKILIGITTPLQVTRLDKASMTLPHLVENNFAIACPTTFDFRSREPLAINDEKAKTTLAGDGQLLLSGAIEPNQDIGRDFTITGKRDEHTATFWSAMPFSTNEYLLTSLGNATRPALHHVTIVVDGGASMRKYVGDIVAALKTAPDSLNADVVFASDDVSKLSKDADATGAVKLNSALRDLAAAPYLGGPDNLPAVLRACKSNKDEVGRSVVWIHGPQPTFFDTAEDNEAIASTTGEAHLYDLAVAGGPNRLSKELPVLVDVTRVSTTGNLRDDIAGLLRGLAAAETSFALKRTVVDSKPAGAGTTDGTLASQLGTLESYDQTLALINAGKREEAMRLASRARLVTEVSGAVVLESEKQYKQNGLDPNNPDKSSSKPTFGFGTAPEPHEILLAAIALFILGWQLIKRRRTCAMAATGAGQSMRC